jgi:hypothetical protein
LDIAQRIASAQALIKQGRDALLGIADAVKDGTLAASATTVEQVDAMLEAERAENRAAYQSVKDAIAEYRAGN